MIHFIRLDYLSHLNEDNNTRVLFERVLSGSTITAEVRRFKLRKNN